MNSRLVKQELPMNSTLQKARRILLDQRGMTSTEYTVLMGIILVGCFAGWHLMGRVIVVLLVGE